MLPLEGLEDPRDHTAERRLAAARFAHQPDHLAVLDKERDIVHCVHHFVCDFGAERARELSGEVERLLEALRDVLDIEDVHSG